MNPRFNPKEFVQVRGRVGEYYSFPDILVGLEKLALEVAEPSLHKIRVTRAQAPILMDGDNKKEGKIESLYKRLKRESTEGWDCAECGEKGSDSSDVLDPEGFLGYVSWVFCHYVLHNLNAVMPTIPMFAAFLEVLKSGVGYDANGDKIPEEKLRKSFADAFSITEGGYRQEWLDAKFDWDREGAIYMEADHRVTREGLDYNAIIELPYKYNPQTFDPEEDVDIITINENAWARAGMPFWLPHREQMVSVPVVDLWTPVPGRVTSFSLNPGYEGPPIIDCTDMNEQSYSCKGVRPVILL